MCVVLGVSVISVFDAVAFLACVHRVSSLDVILTVVATIMNLIMHPCANQCVDNNPKITLTSSDVLAMAGRRFD